MKVVVKGKGDITLNKSDFVAAGGEGEIYIKGRTAYKIYTDPNKMIPLGKIQELAEITDNNVIRPQNIILNTRNKPIGYSMRALKNTHSLCQVFTKGFRDRNGVDFDIVLELVKKLRDMVEHIHSKKILIVDLNEMNFLLSKKVDDIFAIDTDSYQTPNFPATALMESVRDRHSSTFNEETDWFSFGIISFQMFVSIHPYKGKHKGVKGLDNRMMQNISVFHDGVTIPKVCYPFNVIPDAYLSWYKAIFEDGKRVAPPSGFHPIVHTIVTTVQKIVGSDNFDIEEIREVEGGILSVIYASGVRLILTQNKVYFAQRDYPVTKDLKIGLTPKNDIPILAKVEDESLKLYNVSKQEEIPLQIKAEDVFESGHRLYAKTDERILEVNFIETGASVLASVKSVATVHGNASQVFDGVVIQNLLGAYYVSIFPESHVHRQIRIKELDPYRIVDAKYEGNVLMALCYGDQGIYDRFIFRFAKDWASYDARIISDATPSDLNFVVLDSGLCVHINENEELEMFSNKKDSKQVQVVDDPAVSGDMKLFAHGAKLMFAKDNKLFSIKKK